MTNAFRGLWWGIALVAVLSGITGCPSSHRTDDDDDSGGDGGSGACSDVDGDGYGIGPGCRGDDCDEGNPARQDGCASDCAALPEDVGCPCSDDGRVTPCFDADPALAGIGACESGLKSCRAGVWSYCQNQTLPREEDTLGRNGVDDDCNGLVDDLLCGDHPDCGGNCCEAGEVCLGTYCGPPGDCAVDGNCDDDTHCTGDGCVPYQEGETNLDCDGDVVDPIDPIDEFEPDVQCTWGAAGDEVIVPPLVVDLDGLIDDVVEPEIVFTVASNGFGNVQVVALSGASCEERFRTNVQSLAVFAPPAVGDIDGDGDIEIVAVTSTDGVAVFDADGNEQWRTGAGVLPSCCIPALIANLDGAGDAEILVGLRAFDSSGNEIWNVVAPALSPWGIVPVVADVDLDGAQEVVTGNRIIDGASGNVEEVFAELADGNPAIADFDKSTPEPEIAVVSSTGARIQTITGDVIFGPSMALTGAGFGSYYGGPPAIADFDGDGEAEFGSAGGQAYVVFDPDCTADWARDGDCASGRVDGILWQKITQDLSSGATGSSVFDFDFDGTNEVVYNDECFLRVYDGITGATKFIRSNSTGTAYEYPVIADVDGDRQTEIVVAANDWIANCPPDSDTGEPFAGPNRGISIWRDVQDRWAPSRRIWNQHSYSVTNVEEDGRIPTVPENNWQVVGLNNFRVNTRDDPASAERGVDLTVRGLDWVDACPDHITLRAIVANRGIRRAPRGVSVGFYAPGPGVGEETLVCQARTVTDIESGLTETVECDWIDPPVVAVNVHVRVDDTDALLECEEENNDATITDVACEGIE